MSHGTVRATVRAYFDAEVAAGRISAPRLELINRTVRPEGRPDEFVTLDFFGDDETETLGNAGERLNFETGNVRFHIYTQSDTGDGRAVQVGDEIRSALRLRDLSEALRITTVSPTDTDDRDVEGRGRHFEAIVEIGYEFEILG